MQDEQQLLAKILIGQLARLGLVSNGTLLAEGYPWRGFYTKWFEGTLQILLSHHYLSKEGGLYAIVDAIRPEGDVLELWEQEKHRWLEIKYLSQMVPLLDATLNALPDILTERVAATDVIFPNASMALVEGVYKNNARADHFNRLLAKALVTLIQEQLRVRPKAEIKILEVGAGTGGTSSAIFQMLRPVQSCILEYGYTDISKAFLLHAEKEYGKENPYLTYKIFDVEKPFAAQSLEAGGYDFVVAANVLHATQNIRQTVRNVKAALKSGGVILLNEIADSNLFTHLTFGLLEGWWRYQDPHLRIPGSPGLSPETWRQVLEGEGFHHVVCLTRARDQQVIAAESDGVIRQPMLPSIESNEEIGQPIKVEIPSSQRDAPKKSEGSLYEKTVHWIKESLGKTIKLPPEKIEVSATFERYGVDSILQVSFIQELEKAVGGLAKTILFEYPTLKELVDYLVKHRMAALEEHLKVATVEQAVVNRAPLKTKSDRFIKPKTSSSSSTDIAIIGMSGRYPCSNNLEELWANLKAARNCITQAPSVLEDMPWLARSSEQVAKKISGGFLDDPYVFDCQLFGVDQKEALEMTPELRLLLEIVWETLERGGYSKRRVAEWQEKSGGSVGLFVGNMYNQYFWNIPSPEQALLSSNGSDWNIANRISHFFNFTGPSLSINTACSSSLYAIHFACQSLKQGDCSMAVAAGVNLTLNLSKYDMLARARFLGSGNQSKSFGDGDGLIPGEGVGAVLLKSLSRAQEDRDHILAVIKSSTVNHSGGRQIYTAPDPRQQSQLIVNSLRKADIDPKTIGYIECAANGSPLGDAVEAIALKSAFQCYEGCMNPSSPLPDSDLNHPDLKGEVSEDSIKPFCALGSVKSNLGHLEAASAIAQLQKVVMQMRERTLVPTLHARPLNPHIQLDNSPFYLQEKLGAWNQTETEEMQPRRALVNSFGAGGSYGNLIVEEYEHAPTRQNRPRGDESLLIFSAMTAWSLFKYLEGMIDFLKANRAKALVDIAYSLEKINHDLEHRVAIVASTSEEAVEKLEIFMRSKLGVPELNIYTSFDPQEGHSSTNLPQLANDWVRGRKVDCKPLYEGKALDWVNLPTYAFDHAISFNPSRHANLDQESACSVPKQANLDSETYSYDEPYLKGHQLNGKQVVIGATYLSLAARAAFKFYPEGSSARILKLTYLQPIEVEKDRSIVLQVTLTQQAEGSDFQILCPCEGQKRVAATGRFDRGSLEKARVDIDRVRKSLTQTPHIDLLYQERGAVKWGEIFKTLTHLYLGPESFLARVKLTSGTEGSLHPYPLDPLITHSAYLAMLYFAMGQLGIEEPLLPFGIESTSFRKSDPRDSCWLYGRWVRGSEELLLFDIEAIDDNCEIFARYGGYSIKRERPRKSKSVQMAVDSTYPHDNLSAQFEHYLKSKLQILKGEGSSISSTENILSQGLNSSELVRLTKEIEGEVGVELNATLFFEYPTIRELAQFFSSEHRPLLLRKADISNLQEKVESLIGQRALTTYRELIPLNAHREGLPIFWFHGTMGGVESYEKIARQCERPFYGIQAPSSESGSHPLQGIEQMAAYYVKIIRSHQAFGPYDLGGFSLGGMIAYEVTRQLQLAGQTIATLVMIDSPDPEKYQRKRPSLKSLMLQLVNMLLISKAESFKQPAAPISYKQLPLECDDEEFLGGLIGYAVKQGLQESQIRAALQPYVKLQRACQAVEFKILPLLHPESLVCTYFRNQSGLFLGELKEYFAIPSDLLPLDHTAYWRCWREQFRHFQIVDVSSPNHLALLSEPYCETILKECRHIYMQSRHAR